MSHTNITLKIVSQKKKNPKKQRKAKKNKKRNGEVSISSYINKYIH